jgi:peroxin-6
MDRIVAQLLTEIDGVGKKPGLFIIGATNRPDLLDSALLRTGRFDKMIYLGVASTTQEKVKIIQAQVRSMKLSDQVDLDKVASMLPRNFTGADFSAFTSEAYMLAVHRRISSLDKEIADFKASQQMHEDDQLLPETYFKLKYPSEDLKTLC